MKFSIAVNMERTRPDESMSDAASHALDMVTMADAADFEIAWAAEHHCIELTIAPNPFVILTHWAAHTERIRLGTAVVVAPYWNPLRVAGDSCKQGDDAITLAKEAATDGQPFDVVILDIRMPPGIDGVEAGSQIRELDPDVEIVFVTGYSDVPRDELERRVPPPMRLHYFNKPISFMKLAEDVASIVKAH